MSQYVALDFRGVDTIDQITGSALQVVEDPVHGVLIAPQASSDDDMVSLFLGNFRSANTRARYAVDVAAFRAFTGKPLREVTVRDVQEFGASLVHMAPATVAARLTGVKSLITQAQRLGYIPFNVGAPVQLPKIKDDLAERILTEWQVQCLLSLEPNRRNAALIRLLYGAGLRISEACGLLWRDMKPRDDSGQVVVFGKGSKTRVILLSEPLWTRIDALRGNAGPDDAVFRSRQGGALNRSQVHRIVKIAAKRAGLSAEVSAHYLRHSHCSHSLDHGCQIHVVQQTLGHASLTTTTHYTHVLPTSSSALFVNA
jgi:integrase/recombinase XerD